MNDGFVYNIWLARVGPLLHPFTRMPYNVASDFDNIHLSIQSIIEAHFQRSVKYKAIKKIQEKTFKYFVM